MTKITETKNILTNKKAVLLSVLAVLLLPMGVSFAGGGSGNTPLWHPCNEPPTGYLNVHSVTFGIAGTTYAQISYSAPQHDYDWFVVCAQENFYNITFQVDVYNGLNFRGFGVVTTGAVGGVISVPLIQCNCNPVPITLHAGDHISVSITVRYDVGIFYHTGGYGFTV